MDVQNLLVTVFVAVALAHIAWRGYRIFWQTSRTGCGRCAGCGHSKAGPAKPHLMTIELPGQLKVNGGEHRQPRSP